MILDLLFPRICIGCSKIGVYVCSSCLNKFKLREETICPECAKPSVFGRTHPKCQRPTGLDGLWAGFAYKGMIKTLLGKFKYQFVTDVSQTIIELATSLPDWNNFPAEPRLVVPIALHKSRLRDRGFNQAAIIGKNISRYLDWPYSDSILVRNRKTRPQMQLKRKDRLSNLRGAFTYIGPTKALLGVDVLLVDDVWTTGSTMREAAKVLKRQGAKSVWGWVVAR